MAIAFGDSNYLGGASSPQTLSFTTAGSDRIFVAYPRPGTTVTAVSYGGTAATQLVTGSRAEMWYLVNPATGSNTVSVSFTSGNIDMMFGYYTGAETNGNPFDTSEYYSSSGTSISRALTSTSNNCWHVGGNWGDTSNPTAGANTTMRYIYGMMDSNAAITPAGSHTLAYTFASSNNIGLAHAMLKPAGTNITATFGTSRTLMGVGT